MAEQRGPPHSVAATAGLLFGQSKSGELGNGWDTTVTLPLGVIYTLNASVGNPTAAPSDGFFRVQGSGLVGIAGSVESERVFDGTHLLANTVYQVSVRKDDASLASLLGGLSFEIGYQAGNDDVILADTKNGAGLIGVVDILGIFQSSNTATFQFKTASVVPSSSDLLVRIKTNTLAGMLGNQFSLRDLSIQQIPEPDGALLGGIGVLLLFFRRRND